MEGAKLAVIHLDNFALFQHLGDTLAWIQSKLVTYSVMSIFVAGVYGRVILGEKRLRCIAPMPKEAIDMYVKSHKTQK